MDASGKPIASRELLERMIRDQSIPAGKRDEVATAQTVQSFEARMQLEKNRALVRGYKDSKLGMQTVRAEEVRQMGMEIGYGRKKKRPTFNKPKDTGGTPNNRVDSGQNRPSAGFQEPPSRNYNPFG